MPRQTNRRNFDKTGSQSGFCGHHTNIYFARPPLRSTKWLYANARKDNVVERTARILVVDDYEPWRRFIRSALRKRPELKLVGEMSDGLQAVQKAQELEPDLILLDIGLPTINGIQAARRIRECAPKSRILFVSENRSTDIAKEALATGASGFVVKSDAARELLPAVDAILQGKQFVSAILATDIRTLPASE